MAKFLKKLISNELIMMDKDLEGSVLIDFRGLNANDTNEIRRLLREKGVSMNVIPNRLYLRALEEKNNEGFEDKEALKNLLKGPTAVVFGDDGAITASKILVDWKKGHKNKKLEIKGGFLDRRIINKSDIESLANIPSREVLFGQVVSAISSPLSGFAGVLSGVLRSLLYALNGVKDKKEEQS